MVDKRLKLSQELDRLIVAYYKNPTEGCRKAIERKRQKLNKMME